MLDAGLGLFAIGLVCMSLESFGVAAAFFGIYQQYGPYFSALASNGSSSQRPRTR
jgi:hypothetical protein